MRTLYSFIVLTLWTASCLADATKPNIIFIMSDDHAAQTISAYGGKISKVFKTPNIDRLANEGMLLSNAFCTNSICTPSRASILTGQFSHIHGVRTLHSTIKEDKVVYPELLQKHGYKTAVIGKWHLRSAPRGFDYYKVLHKQGIYFDAPFSENGSEVTSKGYVSDVITDESLNWIKENKNSPFCIMIHHKAPHRPCQPNPKYQHLLKDVELPEPKTLFDNFSTRSGAIAGSGLSVTKLKAVDFKVQKPAGMTAAEDKRWSYQTYFKEYLRTTASVDESVGRVLDYLDNNGLRENTIVVYTSDQGFFIGEHGMYDKRFMYDESIRMPFLVRFPNGIKAGSRSDEIYMNVDFAPTFLDFAGVPVPTSMQGISIKPVLSGKSVDSSRNAAYYHLFDGGYGVPKHYGIRTKKYKLIHFYGSKDREAWELYDMEKDPYEVKNLSSSPEYSAVVKNMQSQITQLQKKYGYSEELYEEMKKDSERETASKGRKKKKRKK